MSRRFELLLLTLCVACVTVVNAAAQQTGTLTGVVRDAQGGVLPGVTVSVSGEA